MSEERDCVDNRACSWECGSVGGTFMLPMLATPSRGGTVCVHCVSTSLFKRPWNCKCYRTRRPLLLTKTNCCF